MCRTQGQVSVRSIASVLRCRAGALMLAEAHDGMDRLCRTAVAGVRALMRQDRVS